MKIGITGQAGFIGTHLFNLLGTKKDIERIPFEDLYFDQKEQLQSFVKKCDAIVHLAALNRHNDPQVILDTNLLLVNKLITACEQTGSTPHLVFSSSIQEERDNPYGRSKKLGRELFEKWAIRNQARFSGLIIPNVYGPFGNPYYNSVIATFCHQLAHNEQPRIETDGELKLIYAGELAQQIYELIIEVADDSSANRIRQIRLSHTAQVKVSEILQLLEGYKAKYFTAGEIPALNNPFQRNLFNTFITYIDHSTFFPFLLKLNADPRGFFVETMKLNSGGQISFSTSLPGFTRGDHFHTRKAERFAVIKGKARIQIRRIGTDKIISFELDGASPSFVDMPVWYTHNITNIGSEELYTLFWISEVFNPADPDTYFEKVYLQ
jgi:UDP-2-acetamido-2,6-beta-L-arabino-hexul-4-ose reductase